MTDMETLLAMVTKANIHHHITDGGDDPPALALEVEGETTVYFEFAESGALTRIWTPERDYGW